MVVVNGGEERSRLDCVISVEGDKREETYMIQGECVVPVPKSKRKTCNLTKTQQVMVGVVVGAILGAVAFTAGFLSGEQEENIFDKQLGFSNSTISSIYTSSITPSLTNTSTMLNSVYSSISTTKTNKNNSTDVSSVTKSLISNTTNLNDFYISHSTENNSKQPIKTSTKNSTERSKGRASLESKILGKKKTTTVKPRVTLKRKFEKTTPEVDNHNETMFRSSCEFNFENKPFVMFSVGDMESKQAQYVLPDGCKNKKDLCKLQSGESLAFVRSEQGDFYCMDRDGITVSEIVNKDTERCKSKVIDKHTKGHNKRFVDKIRSLLNGACSKFRSSLFNVEEQICYVMCKNQIEILSVGFERAFRDIDTACKKNYKTNHKVCGIDRSYMSSLVTDETAYIMNRDGSKRSRYSLEKYQDNLCPCEGEEPKSKFGDYMDACITNALSYGCKAVKDFRNSEAVVSGKMYQQGIEN